MFAELGGGGAGLLAEEVAEIVLAGEVEALGNLLDSQPAVRQEELRQIETRLLQMFVDGFMHVFAEQRAEGRIVYSCSRRQFSRTPIAIRIGSEHIQSACDGFWQVLLVAHQNVSRHDEFLKHGDEDQVHLQLPLRGALPNQSPESLVRAGHPRGPPKPKLR